MATLLYRLGRWSFRRRWLVSFVWVVVLGIAGAGMLAGSGAATTTFSVPGTEAQRAFDLLDERFPGPAADGASARVVFRAPDGEQISTDRYRDVVDDVVAALGQSSPRVAAVTDPFDTEGSVSGEGSTAYTQISYTEAATELTDADRDGLAEAMREGRDAGLTVEGSGDALSVEPELLGPTEVVGVVVAAVVLVAALGSLVAAGMPLLTALVGVGIAFAGVAALSGALGFDSLTPILAVMIGLAVGIDYALFIVSRYKYERARGRSAYDAIGVAVGTAGSAVVFAGLTVVIALGGLFVVNMPMLTKMGVAAAGAVVIAVAVGLTLLPAVLGFAGDRILGRRELRAAGPAGAVSPARPGGRAGEVPDGAAEVTAGDPGDERGDEAVEDGAAGEEPAAAGREPLGLRWVRFVTRRPLAVLLTAIVGLGIVALPTADLRLGLPDDGSQPGSTTQRRAYDMLADSFGPGFNGPLLVVVDATDAREPQRVAEGAAATLGGLDGVVTASPAAMNPAGDTATVTVIPATGPTTVGTEDLVDAIRGDVARDAADEGADVLVTGQTALNIDVSQRMQEALVPYLALVIGLAFLLLILVFRSILVPLKAALGFLLSVLASLGVVVAVFQWGWAASLLGVEEPGPIMSLMPVLLIGIVFGLAMDYEVFLVSRMREAYVNGSGPREAVESGFAHGARVVAAAAVIMISVFAGFIGSPEVMIMMVGLGLAVAVLFDAFVVRMTIVPAVLALLGDRAWWLPKRLDRVLPNVDVEGEGLRSTLAADGDPAEESHDGLSRSL
ncbi:MMPL family transporter [Streptomyces hainanensis]|uniref:MMPL family transporter n=1 Tax=Streptomyces hainanensis TaxID=402648 RepID=A0A4R4TGH6_9ACTN|nr:MMPL family transporter [Streptomyces hainanensis]TDC74322.1 MMPL family transporter [Streptomyces hainanensis]